MPTTIATESHAEANQSSGSSPPAEAWASRVEIWCSWCASVEELTILVRAARGVQELATALDVIRTQKGQGIAREVVAAWL